MGERSKPRIFLDINIPRIPDNMQAVRIDGKLAFIPKQEEGDPLFQKTPFTEKQAEAIRNLAAKAADHKYSRMKVVPDSIIY